MREESVHSCAQGSRQGADRPLSWPARLCSTKASPISKPSIKAKTCHFHLAYGANIEATFTSLFGTIIDHRELLFRRRRFADNGPYALALLRGNRAPQFGATRLQSRRRQPAVSRQTSEEGVRSHRRQRRNFGAGFKQHVPDIPEGAFKSLITDMPIPFWDKARMILGVLVSQTPWRNPEQGRVPSYYGCGAGATSKAKT